jgi:hypothetical protein
MDLPLYKPQEDISVIKEQAMGFVVDKTEGLEQEVKNQLRLIGLPESAIDKIFADIEENRIDLFNVEQQIKWLRFRNPKEPPAIFMKALYENWTMPAGYEKQREANLRTGRREEKNC